MRMITALFLGAAILLYGVMQRAINHAHPPPTANAPTIEQLQPLQELTLQRVTVADVMTYEGGWRASWLIRGDGLISVPLRTAQICDVDHERRHARIILEPPRVLSTRIDHDRTRFWDGRQTFMNRVNPWGESLPEISAQAMRGAQRLVQEAVESPANLAQARVSASTLIQALFRGLGWTVTVQWTDGDRKADAEQMLDPKNEERRSH